MRSKKILGMAMLMLSAAGAGAQESYNDRVKRYVDQYYEFAMAEQKNSGVPACITLGQGILETEAGGSVLVSGANNHFGIKCTKAWQGPTFSHTDDAPNECFRKYASAAESYKDHSDHLLTNPRYRPLFALSATDYAGWAVCLKKCGYATNPEYAKRLIKVIEDFKLQEYTYAALDSPMLGNGLPPRLADAPADAPQTGSRRWRRKEKMKDTVITTLVLTPPEPPRADAVVINAEEEEVIEVQPLAGVDSSKIITVNGMKAFYAAKGEMLLPYAVKYHVRYPRLLEMNDLPDAPMPFNGYVYLEKKLTAGTNPTHAVTDGETLLMISQKEGVQLRKLMALNLLNPNEEPLRGSELSLQEPSSRKPDVKIVESIAHTENAIITGMEPDTRKSSEYITINRQTTTTQPVAAVRQQATAQVTAVKQTITEPATPAGDETAEEEEEESDEQTDDLLKLKADLDKVVYADDSKLPQTGGRRRVVNDNASSTGTGYYKVRKGETASAIAARNGITVKQLMAWNSIMPDKIREGQNLRVTAPGQVATAPPPAAKITAPPATAATGGLYEVKKGETVSAIAKKNGITIKQLLAWNHVEADKIRAGQQLKVTADATGDEEEEEEEETATVQPAQRTQAPTAVNGMHTIQKGETASAIAQKNGITVKQLLAWNNVEADKIRAGQQLRVAPPTGSSNNDDSPTARPAKTAASNKYHVVEKGETLGGIAERNDVTVKQLMKWNAGLDPKKMRDGKKLRVKE